VKHNFVSTHSDCESASSSLECQLEPRIRERLNSSAIVADQVMVVLAGRVCRLEPGHAVAELDSLHELEIDELVERAVDARDPDATTPAPDAVENLVRRSTAGLDAQVLDHRAAGPSVAKPCRLEVRERARDPRRVGSLHQGNDTDSH
jgi:hypothetical protein